MDENAILEIKLKKAVEYDGETYEKLTFDFGKLTGEDAQNIEEELAALGKTPIAAALSTDYLIRMAAKACREPIGADLFGKLTLPDFERIKTRARSFLLGTA